MSAQDLVSAWLALVALSTATTALTLVERGGHSRMVISVTVLVLAGLKARIILARYLGLAASRFWTRGFDIVLAVFLLLAITLYLAGGAAAGTGG